MNVVDVGTYNRLKEKYEKVKGENKKLRGILDKMMQEAQTIQLSHNSIKNLVTTIEEKYKSASSDFSTAATTLKEGVSKRHSLALSLSGKKVEEIEKAYFEIVKNFNILIIKFKTLNAEKNNIISELTQIREENKLLREKLERGVADSLAQKRAYERSSEISDCIENMYYNSLILNCDKSMSKDCVVGGSRQYIRCEPVPTFVKFLKNLN